eukprot:c3887_g1_i1.p1 GENE.c3887_g1_i1~~c3887_g1_i1.p1  ORF type:complete len:339 (+),score=54.34 c3887_g1_i1:68-1084(+)
MSSTPPAEFFWTGHIVSTISSVMSMLGSAVVLLTFHSFPFLKRHPRDLYVWFSLSALFDGILSTTVFVLTVMRGHRGTDCLHSVLTRILVHYCRTAEFLWLCCISHAIHNELTISLQRSVPRPEYVRSTSSSSMASNASVRFRGQWAYKARLRIVYHIISWGFPLVFTVLMLTVTAPCTFSFGVTKLHSLLEERLWDDILSVFMFLVTLVLLVNNMRKASHLMNQLQIGTEFAAISPRSFSHTSVYVGMLITFGVVRVPSIAIFTILTIDNSVDMLSSHEFWRLWVASLFFAPLVGFSTFCWFSYKFRFYRLWRNRFRTFLGRPISDGPLIEALVGVF